MPGAAPQSSVTVAIGKAVRNVIVAHSVVDAPDDSLGAEVAEYVFHRAGGREERAPIRAGFQNRRDSRTLPL